MVYIWGVGAAQGHGDVELIPCFRTILGGWCGWSAAYPNHEHHRQPTLEGQHHKPCPNTPTQDPSQDWRG